MGLVQKAFSDIITFSRSSNATRVGPNGLIQYAPHNLLLYSQELDNAAWSASATAIVRTANTTTAPDGTVTADSWLGDGTTAVHYSGQLVTLSSTLTYAFSFYAKANGVNFVQVILGSGTGYANFNITAGAGVVGTSASPFSSLSIQDVGNNWYRCSCIITNSAASNIYFALSNSASALRAASSFSTSNGIYLWGAQLAVGPLALDYTPTTTAAVYGPRFDYDGSGVTSVDPIARNLLTYSQEFDNAAWAKNLSSVTANSVSAPDGTVTGDKLVEDNSTGVHYLNVVGTLTGSTVYSISVYAKAGERSRIQIAGAGGAWGSSATATFDLSAGTVVSTSVWSSSSISAVGNGWYRCSVTGTTVAVPSSAQYLQLVLIASGTTQSYAGDGTSGIYLWGAQLEVGSTATGYMVSGATNGFRAVPVVTGNATARGLLVEEARTNLLTYSEDYSNAAWTKTNSTVTANSATSPDGTVTADLISGTGAGQVITQTVTANGTQQTLSFFVKKPSSGVFSGATLLFYNLTTTSVIGLAKFSGETFTVNATTGTATNTAYGNGWYRITLTNSSGLSSGNLLTCYLYPDNLAGGSNANDTVLAWGAQCE